MTQVGYRMCVRSAVDGAWSLVLTPQTSSTAAVKKVRRANHLAAGNDLIDGGKVLKSRRVYFVLARKIAHLIRCPVH